ncbi:MAG: type VI secretion system accessory protein TagJ [Pseudomonadota bacterium]
MTTDAESLLRAGDPKGALQALQASVRAKPQDATLRIFLFQLLAVLGDWQRAVTQLKLCAELDEDATPMAQTYREGIICEVFREKVFAADTVPLMFGEPLDWAALMLEALERLKAGEAEAAAGLRARAFDIAPATPGRINGEPFAWIADADPRLGPMLEVIVNGRYFWMPFSAIAKLEIDQPADLRDFVWTPAMLTLQNGGEFVVLIPTRYAGTTAAADPQALMARVTTWDDAGSDTFIGTGQRLLTTDQNDYALMDVRTIEIDPIAQPAPAAAEPATGGQDG